MAADEPLPDAPGTEPAGTEPAGTEPAGVAPAQPWGDPPHPGGELVRATWVGTGVLAVTSFVAVVLLGPVRYLHVAVVLAMFVLGCLLFLRAYWTAVQRSREVEIGIGGLYFLAGPTAPKAVRSTMNWSLALQTLIAVAAASARPFTTLAFGVLAPMLGLGLNGVWGATYGHFGPRIVDGPRRPKPPSSRPEGSIGKNAPHG
jgi:hypothetical protein